MSDTPAPPSRTGVRTFSAPGQKVPPFARYKGTSAWRKYRNRVREFNRYQDALKQAQTVAPVHTAPAPVTPASTAPDTIAPLATSDVG